MSKQRGMMLICDRCLKEVFIKESVEILKEPFKAEGWGQRCIGHKTPRVLDLCPECTEFLDKFIEEFCK